MVGMDAGVFCLRVEFLLKTDSFELANRFFEDINSRQILTT